MKCPECGEIAKRVDSVTHKSDADGWSIIVRRRRCQHGHSFETYECYEYADVEVIFKVREAIKLLQGIAAEAHP